MAEATATAAAGSPARPPRSGVLVVDKPRGVTSHDVVAAVRAAVGMKKVGHAGTLDPMATGALVVGFGNATRLLNYIVDHDKTYVATIRFGIATTTDDADGETVSRWNDSRAGSDAGLPDDSRDMAPTAGSAAATSPSAVPPAALPSIAEIRAMIDERFTGPILQVPNTYSAIKINGQRAYDLAREGRDVELAPREVTIEQFDVLGSRETIVDNATEEADEAEETGATPVLDVDVRVRCSAGTYIRALARDLGAAFGAGAHLTMLRRERVGDFAVDDPKTLAAHAEPKTFTNRAGETVTRNRAILDLPGLGPNGRPATGPDGDGARAALAAHVLTMAEAVARTMPIVPITADEANELRFGRFIPVAADLVPANFPDREPKMFVNGPAAAVVVDDNGHATAESDVVAIVERRNRRQWKPLAVFAAGE
ncbi:tRNA pseudouridine synthase B [Bifidobacterium choloepi]|uniref:tRNA pseudouridine synthase B n=1 Tax=Bifidobacterium choloepi TaxID=2614131 RepID=A0A6I5NH41_9BIFI|nr:tRNA pseudouridine(55) synthase TruB [Bifidobacterium choloepi]NEG69623.1 tRNA pseudouridine(55) synthase TruB [Bifidobacterium choloepi]